MPKQKPSTKKKPSPKSSKTSASQKTSLGLLTRLIDVKKPTSKLRITIDIVLVLFVIGVIGLILYENNRHHKLQVSAENLKASMEAQGLRVSDVDTDCEKGGKAIVSYRWHQCTMIFTHRTRGITIEDANKRIDTINRVMASQQDYSIQQNKKELQHIKKVNEQRPNSGMKLAHKSTKRNCSLYYDTDETRVIPSENKIDFDVIFTCDDDSWFNKTFRN